MTKARDIKKKLKMLYGFFSFFIIKYKNVIAKPVASPIKNPKTDSLPR